MVVIISAAKTKEFSERICFEKKYPYPWLSATKRSIFLSRVTMYPGSGFMLKLKILRSWSYATFSKEYSVFGVHMLTKFSGVNWWFVIHFFSIFART